MANPVVLIVRAKFEPSVTTQEFSSAKTRSRLSHMMNHTYPLKLLASSEKQCPNRTTSVKRSPPRIL